ncbi:aspartate/glutamate racemase family protein [Ottowia thiooxydans]|uniref:aspartate/glutamate racemase family protein n=1 Tax=Ottowia thiooxydans TaxID=219182 RepID=UPI000490C67C|nr:aspartate/glutamate racemase family protein [Ottowia thiooxydans]
MTKASAWPAYNAALRDVLVGVAEPDTEIEIHGITGRGGVGDQYRYLEFIETLEVLENVERATREGFDAFLIGNSCDPGLREAREITDMPVLGLGETSGYVASLMAGNFAIVTGSQKHVPRLIENYRRYGHALTLHSARSMQMIRLVDLDEGFSNPAVGAALIERFLSEAESVAAEGAELVIPAVGVLMALLAREQVHETASGIPIMNGVKALVKMGETAVKLRASMGGVWTSRRNAYQQPPASQLAEIRRHYGAVYSTLPDPDSDTGLKANS